ncbi:hypothetical protein [Photorhabdus laumondii]
MCDVRLDIFSKFEVILNNYSFEYFQSLDCSGKFPEDFFDELKLNGLLSYEINCEQDFHTFSHIATLIGQKSVAASLCWVMHNQQFNTILRIKPSVLSNQDFGLMASMTSSYGGKWHGDRDKIVQASGEAWIIREAPIVSYVRYSDSVVFTFPKYDENQKVEIWLALTSTKHCSFNDSNELLTAVKSTCSEPSKVHARLSEIEYIGPFHKTFSGIFVPIAHIGWMSAYNGGLRGVLSRLRKLNRNVHSAGSIKKMNHSSLSKNRLAKSVSIEATNQAMIAGTIKSIYSESRQRFIDINAVKTRISEALLETTLELEVELGVSTALKQNDAIGLEMYSRDVRTARLMFNNDDIYELIYKHWILGM